MLNQYCCYKVKGTLQSGTNFIMFYSTIITCIATVLCNECLINVSCANVREGYENSTQEVASNKELDNINHNIICIVNLEM